MSESQLRKFNWLAFSIALENHLGLISYLRDNNHTPEKIGQLISEHMTRLARDRADSGLSAALHGKLPEQKLARLHSDPVRRKAEQALAWEQKRPDHHLICLDNPRYPKRLLDTVNPPTVIYAKGSLAALQPPALAIVGARKASHTAIRRTREFSAELSEQGLCIVSGLAMGIDAAAHLGSLEKNGITIAVAATEPETVYPARHQLLNNRIIDSGGLVLTENPLDAQTLKWHFPRRNRIISGLSAGVLVTEAALPSGSLTTATHALEQGRDVMAIPGSIDDPLSRGCHALIKQGAALVETPSDILDALGQQVRDQLTVHSGRSNSSDERPSKSRQPNVTKVQSELEFDNNSEDSLTVAILENLAAHPATADELLGLLGSDVATGSARLGAALGLLELDGKIRVTAGGRYTRC